VTRRRILYSNKKERLNIFPCVLARCRRQILGFKLGKNKVIVCLHVLVSKKAGRNNFNSFFLIVCFLWCTSIKRDNRLFNLVCIFWTVCINWLYKSCLYQSFRLSIHIFQPENCWADFDYTVFRCFLLQSTPTSLVL
jgi:hypothetical protein